MSCDHNKPLGVFLRHQTGQFLPRAEYLQHMHIYKSASISLVYTRRTEKQPNAGGRRGGGKVKHEGSSLTELTRARLRHTVRSSTACVCENVCVPVWGIPPLHSMVSQKLPRQG